MSETIRRRHRRRRPRPSRRRRLPSPFIALRSNINSPTKHRSHVAVRRTLVNISHDFYFERLALVVLRDVLDPSFYSQRPFVELDRRFFIVRVGPDAQHVLIGDGHTRLGVPQQALELHGPVLDLGAGPVLERHVQQDALLAAALVLVPDLRSRRWRLGGAASMAYRVGGASTAYRVGGASTASARGWEAAGSP